MDAWQICQRGSTPLDVDLQSIKNLMNTIMKQKSFL